MSVHGLSDSEGLYISDALAGVSGISHVFAGRKAGDGRQPGVGTRILELLRVPTRPVIRPRQIHGTTVSVLTDGVTETVVADGLSYSAGNGMRSLPALAVVTADCVPILLADPVRRTVTSVHAGWKGTVGGIAGEAVRAMIRTGSDQGDILAALGPHIGSCCYDVPEERAGMFASRFGAGNCTVVTRGRRYFLDLSAAIVADLRHTGVKAGHIDVCGFCTSCDNDRFFSYRKDTQDTYGENISLITVGEPV